MRNQRSPCEPSHPPILPHPPDRHTFGADVHRFKHSFLGRLDLAAELPGPGWYAPLQIPEKKEKAPESPGREGRPVASGVFK
jgi:hypothetical protein